MTSQEIHTRGDEIKAKKRIVRRRRPRMFTNEWADITALPINVRRVGHLTDGWSLERMGALVNFVRAVWIHQRHLPGSIDDLTAQEVRGWYRMDPRTARRFLDEEMRSAVVEICSRRAPLCQGGREWVFEKSEGRCHHCDTHLDPATFHVDHLVPVACGGLTNNANLVASCPPCNWSKGARVS